jgi:hypothetical protein
VAPTSRDRPAKSDIDPYLDFLLSNIAHSKSSNFTPEFAKARLRVNRVDSAMSAMSPLYPQEPRSSERPATSEKCHNRKWGGPYSITPSARASSDAGKERPSALAVFKLTISSNLVGSTTGKSLSFSPLRMRPM